MSKSTKRDWRYVLLIPAVFILIASAAFLYGMYNVRVQSGTGVEATALPSGNPTAEPLSVEEYRLQVSTELAPLWVALSAVRSGTEPDIYHLTDLADNIRTRILDLRIPDSEKEVHLEIVLMLDGWRALAAAEDGGAAMLEKTDRLVRDNPWLAR